MNSDFEVLEPVFIFQTGLIQKFISVIICILVEVKMIDVDDNYELINVQRTILIEGRMLK